MNPEESALYEQIDKLEKESTYLKGQIDNLQKIKAEDIKILWCSIDVLRQQLFEIKYLDRQEVEGIFDNVDPHLKINWRPQYEVIITAICNLAVPEIDSMEDDISILIFDYITNAELSGAEKNCRILAKAIIKIIKRLGDK